MGILTRQKLVNIRLHVPGHLLNVVPALRNLQSEANTTSNSSGPTQRSTATLRLPILCEDLSSNVPDNR